MRAAFHLAARYVLRHRIQSALLAGALGLVFALPLCLRVLIEHAQQELRARAAATPQIVGTRGSALDLMMTALYFKRENLLPLPFGALSELQHHPSASASTTAAAIPLHVRYQAQGAPIVGTELEYFPFRGLRLAAGKQLSRLGDCVVGATLARQRGLQPGGHLFSTPEQAFDMAGVYPLKMRVTGILTPNGTPDDEALFVDLKTCWLIEGRSHGHDDLKTDESVVLTKEEGNIVGNAAVRMFNEVTDANIASFHFHGDVSTYPISAVILLPTDAKAEALLAGQFARSKEQQLIRPRDEMEALLTQLVRLEGFAASALLLTATAALLVTALVFALSFRLRQREFATLEDVGVSRVSLISVKVLEVLIVGLVAAVIGAVLLSGSSFAAPYLLRWAL
ncbi:ABC transporter permease [Prosthecobacter sp.]|uniref:FtsX-like permease family protein n=1 Tax=Prosthecobacter sp. TaxID=1965333 RepID=UPI0024878589|nr:ABC transporter permease [Prosthecobacter sp.]MDI1310509.1 ABC transporter permease [Prosthecobacter sp.]